MPTCSIFPYILLETNVWFIAEVTLDMVHDLLNEKTSQATIDDSFDNWTCHALINIRLRCFWLKDMVIRKGKVGNSMRPANLVPKMPKLEVDSVKLWKPKLHINNFASNSYQLLRIRKEQVCPSRPNWIQETSFSSLQLSGLDMKSVGRNPAITTTERMVLKLY